MSFMDGPLIFQDLKLYITLIRFTNAVTVVSTFNTENFPSLWGAPSRKYLRVVWLRGKEH